MKRWIALGIAVVLAIFWFLWSTNRVPELQRVPVDSQDTLVVHAFLDQRADSLQLGSVNFQSDGIGTTIVMSYRSTNPRRDSDWRWLKCIRVPDNAGSFVDVEVALFTTISAGGSLVSTGLPSEKPDVSDGITYCYVTIPKVETEGPCQYHLLNFDDQTVATIVSPFAPSVPSTEFNQHPHQVATTSGPWKCQILGMTFGRYTKGSMQDGSTHHHGPPEKLWFEFDGQVLQKDEVAVVDLCYSDALGNKSTRLGLPPDLQPRWKMSMKVGRIDYMANRNASELKYLGRFDDLKSKLELSPSDDVPELSSAFCFGLGNHEISMPYTGRADRNFKDYRAGMLGQHTGASRFLMSSSSSQASDSWRYDVTYSIPSENNDQRIDVRYQSRASQGTTMKVYASVPLIALNLNRPLENQIINVFAFDQLNRPLRVSSVVHPIQQMPLYIVESDTDTEHIELYTSIEDLVPLVMYFVPPTRGVEFPPTTESFSYLNFTPSPVGWNRQ